MHPNPGIPVPEPTASRPVPGEPIPGGHIPTEIPPGGPTGPRNPYPAHDPGIGEPPGPGCEPDYLPGGPSNPSPRYAGGAVPLL
jgi:hypothetical protein